jgi:hypothetical protein
MKNKQYEKEKKQVCDNGKNKGGEGENSVPLFN